MRCSCSPLAGVEGAAVVRTLPLFLRPLRLPTFDSCEPDSAQVSLIPSVV